MGLAWSCPRVVLFCEDGFCAVGMCIRGHDHGPCAGRFRCFRCHSQDFRSDVAIAISAFAIDINTYPTENADFMARSLPEFETGQQKGNDGTNSAGVVHSRFDPFPRRDSKGEFLGQVLGFSSDRPFRSVTLSKVSKGTFTLDSLQFLPDPAPVPGPEGFPLLAAALFLLCAARPLRGTRQHPA